MSLPSITISVPLSRLRFGQEHPLGDYNMRKTGRDQDRPELRATLRDDWVLQNLVATTHDVAHDDGVSPLYVIIGNSRKRECDGLAEESVAFAEKEVPLRLFFNLTREQAMAIAVAEELPKLPPHPVDQYEAFAAIGGTPESVAQHYGISVRLAKQRLALGVLSPKVRQAWKDGLIDQKAAQAFTLAPDIKTQEKEFARLKSQHALVPHSIRAAFLPEQGDVCALVEFVGTAAYVAAGGQVIEDLFEGRHGVSDEALAKKLADDKLEAEAQRLVAEEKWGWASPVSQLPREWQGWERSGVKAKPTKEEKARWDALQKVCGEREEWSEEYEAAEQEMARLISAIEYREFTDRQKKKSGCAIEIGDDGRLVIHAGIIKPDDAPRILADKTSKADENDQSEGDEPPAEKVPAREPPPTLSLAAQSRRAAELTDAAAHVLRDEPELALIVLLAGFASNSDHGVVRVHHGGQGSPALRLMDGDSFARNLARLKAMKLAARNKLLAEVAAASLLFQCHSMERPAIADDDVAAIVNLLPGPKLDKALAARFDLEDYTRAAPKKLLLEAIEEGVNYTQAKERKDAAKGELSLFVCENVPDTWLPPMLRSANYAGPGAKKKSAKSAAKPAPKVKAEKRGRK